MTLPRRSVLCLFALIASCGPAGEGPGDTASVGGGTRPAATGSPVEAPISFEIDDDVPSPAPAAAGDVALPSAPATMQLLGFAGSRFAVLDTPEIAVVVDAATEPPSAFGVYGHPVRVEQPLIRFGTAGLVPTDLPTSIVASQDGRVLLVRTDAGVQAVDLTRRGALLTGFRGDARRVEIAPDGGAFVVVDPDALHVVRTSDGARARYALAASSEDMPHFTWREASVSWTDDEGAHVVDRSTLLKRFVARGARIDASKDGRVVAVGADAARGAGDVPIAPGSVDVLFLGTDKPTLHVASAFVNGITIDEAGESVAWVEHAELEAPQFLHTLDLGSASHVRFPSKASPCSIDDEHLVGIVGTELHTNDECSPGCPSLESRPHLLAYDLKTGALLRTWDGPTEPPFNERLGRERAEAERVAKRFGLEVDETSLDAPIAMLRHTTVGTFVVERPRGLLIGDASGHVSATLEASKGFRVEDARFWPGMEARVIGVHEGTAALWDAATGARIWTSRR